VMPALGKITAFDSGHRQNQGLAVFPAIDGSADAESVDHLIQRVQHFLFIQKTLAYQILGQ